VYGTKVFSITQNILKQTKVILPSRKDQESIVSYLDSKTAAIDSLITNITVQIEKLKEYRQSIISEVVTGKVMVTDAIESSVREKPFSKREAVFKRLLLSAYILDNICDEPTAGRVKFEKLLYLSEHHAELPLRSDYRRHAAGPYDPKALYGIEKQLKDNKWFDKNKDKKDSRAYVRLEKSDGYAPAKFTLCYFRPVSGMNQTDAESYHKNILSITRQVRYSTKNENSIDVVLFVNGLPIITLELKNPITGQTVEHAKRQYKLDRSHRELLFVFKTRCLVHFAVDTDEVFMTTKLAGTDTYFLPFNKGNNGGKGNPVGEGNYRTSYLWDEVLQKDSVLDIIQRFIHLQQKTDEATGKTKETLIFPRYHQLDAVRKLIANVSEKGTGQNYLIQHSAGSGKSNSISWLAHHLQSLHDSNDKIIFNSVIVITDRRVLDKQLQDTIYQFEHVDGVVTKIDNNSSQLADALNTGKKIIITTLQKFPFIVEKVKDLSGKRFAVIVDEAHSSQTGEAARKLKAVIGDEYARLPEEERLQKIAETEAKAEQNQTDSEDEIAKEMSTHGQLQNLSFFAFTATPKPKTIEMFGTCDDAGLPSRSIIVPSEKLSRISLTSSENPLM